MGRPKKPPRLVVNTCEHCGTEYSIPFKQRKQRFCSNKCSASFPANINQRTRTMRKTWLEKYGKNPMQLEETKDKFRETMLKKHGVEFSQQKKEFVEKSKQTKFENFGNRNFNNRELAKQTILKKKLKFNKKIPEDQFKQEMLDFLKEHESDWTLGDSDIQSMGIDVLSRKLKLGVDCDSLINHTEISGKKNRLYHTNKSRLVLLRGINLVHVWDYEWLYKKDIVQSILLNLMNKPPNVIDAGDCTVKQLKPNIANEFLIQNHIQSMYRCPIHIGLFWKDELVSVMSFKKPSISPCAEFELTRFCHKKLFHVQNGNSTMFKFFLKTYNPKSVVTYSNRRYFSGEEFQNLGFHFVDHTSAKYHYVNKQYTNVESRSGYAKFRLKEKLSSFDEKLSEWENMKKNGYDRIWDCGNSKWVFNQKVNTI